MMYIRLGKQRAEERCFLYKINRFLIKIAFRLILISDQLSPKKEKTDLESNKEIREETSRRSPDLVTSGDNHRIYTYVQRPNPTIFTKKPSPAQKLTKTIG